MPLLALNTTQRIASVALLDTNNNIIELSPPIDLPQHSQSVLIQIQQLLEKCHLNKLDAIAFACGPGSFTSIRLGATLVQSLAWRACLPVIPISSLQLIAQYVYVTQGITHAAIAINAYGGKIYWGCYQAISDIMTPTMSDSLCTPDSAKLHFDLTKSASKTWVGVGDGWLLFQHQFLKQPILPLIAIPEPIPSKILIILAQHAWQTGKQVEAKLALPVYLWDDTRWKREL